MTLRVCSYNIRFILDRYDERQELVESVIEAADADIYGFQEVLVGGHYIGQQKDVCHRLNKNVKKNYTHFDCEGFRLYTAVLPLGLTHLYHNPIALVFYDLWALFNKHFLSYITGPYTQWLYHHPLLRIVVYFLLGTCWVFGTTQVVDRRVTEINSADSSDSVDSVDSVDSEKARNSTDAVLSLKHHILRVGGFRGVGVVEIYKKVQTADGPRVRRILHINVHLSSAPEEEDIRVDEGEQILSWLKSLEAEDAAAGRPAIDGVIIGGDFNAIPDGKCYSFFTNNGFISAYKEANGEEPLVTFHQNHSCPTKDEDEEKCLDYIMYKGDCLKLQAPENQPLIDEAGGDIKEGGSVTHRQPVVSLIGTKCCGKDHTVYPSDHYGIVANFAVI